MSYNVNRQVTADRSIECFPFNYSSSELPVRTRRYRQATPLSAVIPHTNHVDPRFMVHSPSLAIVLSVPMVARPKRGFSMKTRCCDSIEATV